MVDSTIPLGANRRIRVEKLLLLIVQSAVVLGILYSTWHLGAVQSVALKRLCCIAGIGLVAAVGTTCLRSDSIDRLPIRLWILLAVWIVYAFVQTAPLPSGLNIWFARAQQQSDDFRDHAFELADSAKELANITSIEPTIASGSAIREATFQAVVPYLLALAFSVLASIGFHQDGPRRALLWAIIINATVMATWGIVQRSGGGIELLPGIENNSGGSPFGSFVYKNAGAAALLPAFACLAAVVLMRSRRQSSGYMTGVDSTQTSPLSKQLETLFIPFCLFLAGILITGLVASLSRGAWLAALVTLLVVGGMLGVRSLSRRACIALAGGIALMIAIVVVTGIGGDIQHQAKRVSVATVAMDQRWNVWVDSSVAALAYLPSGSGLGTYGYAALPFQSEPRTEWFREAHNQYLETLTETGLIGIVVVLLGMIWFGRISYRLLRTGNAKIRLGSTRSAMGMVGASLLLCGAIQNTFDFVIKIPAILLLYSILVSVVATTRLDAKTTGKRRSAIRSANQTAIAPITQVAWMVISLGCVIVADRIANRQVHANRILGASAVTGIVGDKSDQELEIELQRLDAAIACQPQRAQLYLCRARALEQEYQRNLIQSAGEMGISLEPENARLATIHALLATSPATSCDALRTDFVRTPKLVTPLGRMVADLHTAILLNPYDPHTQYECALFSPLGRYSIDPWLNRTSALDNSNYMVLFNNGLLAYYEDDHEQMISQWSNSLAIRHDHLGKILDLASEKVSITEIAKRLVPSNRPDRIVALATVYKSARPDSTNQSPISELIEYVQNSARFDPAKRHATLAGLHNLQGNDDLAIEHWKQSLRLQPMNSKFRISLVSTLRDAGRPEDALNQAVIGQRLFPSDRRFDRQSRSIRRSLINL